MKMTSVFKEGRMLGVTPIKLSEKADLSALKVGERIQVVGITKGHGFVGVVGRHSFRGGPKTHGQKNRLRMPGSIGNTSPQRVLPGRRMAGHMGMVRRNTKNVPLVEIQEGDRVVMLNGSVPGTIGRKVELFIPEIAQKNK